LIYFGGKIRNTNTHIIICRCIKPKAWAYVLTKSKKEKRAEVSVKTIQGFKDEFGLIRGLEGNIEFLSVTIRNFCNDNDIRLDTSVAKEEYVANGNKLGIIDRLVRTIRELIEKYYDITGHRTDNIKDVMKSMIDAYNNYSHRTLENKTPYQVFKDNDDQITRKNIDMHNIIRYILIMAGFKIYTLDSVFHHLKSSNGQNIVDDIIIYIYNINMDNILSFYKSTTAQGNKNYFYLQNLKEYNQH
jgi:hypothetical protein